VRSEYSLKSGEEKDYTVDKAKLRGTVAEVLRAAGQPHVEPMVGDEQEDTS
jgi:hypothetical protein